jgi:hypothetical protein
MTNGATTSLGIRFYMTQFADSIYLFGFGTLSLPTIFRW